MNEKIIKALKGISDNLNVIISELEADNKVIAKAETVAVEEVETPAPKTSRKEREASEQLPDPTKGHLTQEQLDGLSYNNLKRLAKEMGIPAIGSREELTQKILNEEVELGEEVSEEVAQEVEEEIKAVKGKTAVQKPPRAQKAKVVEEVEEEDDEEEEEVDPVVAKVNEAVEDMTDEEIMDVLADVGVKAKGKRQALISAVIKAVREGKIDLDEEAEEAEEVEAPEEESADEETEAEQVFDVNDSKNPEMTEERREAIKENIKEVRESFKNGDLTRKELVQWLNDFYGTKDTMKNKSDEEILNKYIYCTCLFIDDEGNQPDEGAYVVNGVVYCCGKELAYNEDNNTYICEVCGTEYEAEE